MVDTGLINRSQAATSMLPKRVGVLEIVEELPRARFVLRGEDDVISVIGAALNLALNGPINRAVSHNGYDALRIGPDEWLLISNRESADDLSTKIRHAAHDAAFSLVDIGHRNVGLHLSGSAVITSLSAGCPQALELSRFPVSKCSRTIFGKAEIVLWRRAEFEFHLEIWRSFAPYFLDYLMAETTDLKLR